MSALTAAAFEKFLIRLDDDEILAGEKYLLLRQKLVKTLTWKGCAESQADALADVVLDRVAGKLESGEEILKINAYASEVLRFVWLEHLRKNKEEAFGDEEEQGGAVQPEIYEEIDLRTRCLRSCLAEFDQKDARLIVGYYDTDAGDKLKEIRRKLATAMDYPMETPEEQKKAMTRLKVRAFHLRERLEKCINQCTARLSVTKRAISDTNNQGGFVR